tara:strand:+ start:9281 stop:9970 length:690 start_codon:yes stop_codon:yes gene_type:complete
MITIHVILFYIKDLSNVDVYLKKNSGDIDIQIKYYLNNKVDFKNKDFFDYQYYDDKNSLDFDAFNSIIFSNEDKVSLVMNDTFFTKHKLDYTFKEMLSRCQFLYENEISKPILIGPYSSCNYRSPLIQNDFVVSYMFAFNDKFSKIYKYELMTNTEYPKRYSTLISIYKYYIDKNITYNNVGAKCNAVIFERLLSEVAFNNGIIWYLHFRLIDKFKYHFLRILNKYRKI